MGRGKGAVTRKDAAPESTMVGRRSLMEHIYPYPMLPVKRSHADLQTQGQAHGQKGAQGRMSITRQSPHKRLRTSTMPSHARSATRSASITAKLAGHTIPQAYPHPSHPPLPNLLYAPFRTLDVEKIFLHAASDAPVTARVHVPAEHLTVNNPAIKARHLWGHHRYTDDSDIVAIMLHNGVFKPTVDVPTTFQYLSVLIELTRHVRGVSPGFPSAVVNSLASRECYSYFDGAALRIVRVAMVNGDIATIPARHHLANKVVRVPRLVQWDAETAVGTTTAPRDGKVVAKRSCVSGGVLCFDLLGDACMVYDILEVASSNETTTVQRLRDEVLYVEDGKQRFEISLLDGDSHGSPCVRFSRVAEHTLGKLRLVNSGLSDDVNDGDYSLGGVVTVPMRTKFLQIISRRIAWSKLVWDCDGVTVNGVHYGLTKMSFRKRHG